MYTLVGDNGNGGYVCMGAKVIWKSLYLLPQFCCEPKIALKNKVFFKKSSDRNDNRFSTE